MKEKLVGLLLGALFGVWLGWTGFTRYDVILDALLFRDWYLWAVFFSAAATGFAGLRVLRAARAKTLLGAGTAVRWDTPKLARDHVIGSALFGIGWGVAGTCPGPVVAQLGRGQLAGLFTGLGILAGISLCDRWIGKKPESASPCA